MRNSMRVGRARSRATATLASSIALVACSGGGIELLVDTSPKDAPPLDEIDDSLGIAEALIQRSTAGNRDVLAFAACGSGVSAVGLVSVDGELAATGYSDAVPVAVVRDGADGSVRVDATVVRGVGAEWRSLEDATFWLSEFPTPDLIDLRSLAGVEAAFQLDRADAATRSDERGTFLRFETLPYDLAAWIDDHDVDSSPGRPLGLPEFRYVWVLDIWSDGDEVTRLRVLRAEDGWAEVRFEPAGSELPDPDDLGCEAAGPTDDGDDPGWAGWEPWEQRLSVPLRASFDPDGRPYDSEVGDDGRAEVEPRGTFRSPDGDLLVADGSIVACCLPMDVEVEAVVVDFGDGPVDLELSILWRADRFERRPFGIRFDVPNASVERWEALEFAYATDAGSGGVTTRSVNDRATREAWFETQPEVFVEHSDAALTASVSTTDLDGEPGLDTVVFENGFGDGAFPMARGVADGRLVALVILDPASFPWRLAIPDGTPPPDITDREDQIAACAAGTRPVELDGTCSFDPE